MCHVQRFKNVSFILEKTCLWFKAAALECESTCLWPLESSRRASWCDDALLFPLVSDAVTDRRPTGRCIKGFIGHIQDCKVIFFKAMLFKTCLHVKTEKKVHNAR